MSKMVLGKFIVLALYVHLLLYLWFKYLLKLADRYSPDERRRRAANVVYHRLALWNTGGFHYSNEQLSKPFRPDPNGSYLRQMLREPLLGGASRPKTLSS